MAYGYIVQGPMFTPTGYGVFTKLKDAVEAAKRETGCGLRVGIRAKRVMVNG